MRETEWWVYRPSEPDEGDCSVGDAAVRRSVWENLIDRTRAVAYIRYHIDFRACLRAWFVARLESAMETSGQDRFGADAFSVGVIVSGIEPVER